MTQLARAAEEKPVPTPNTKKVKIQRIQYMLERQVSREREQKGRFTRGNDLLTLLSTTQNQLAFLSPLSHFLKAYSTVVSGAVSLILFIFADNIQNINFLLKFQVIQDILYIHALSLKAQILEWKGRPSQSQPTPRGSKHFSAGAS